MVGSGFIPKWKYAHSGGYEETMPGTRLVRLFKGYLYYIQVAVDDHS